MDQTAAKQQIVERIKQANNILVTVSNNPSVDQLAACIGLTLLLNKMGKHATAVYSGATPSTIEFLQPEKTLETNTDSLQDFIISLDKNKADKLRYKVEDQVVKIFITPYRTKISEQDLVFSHGDFNVEVVLALGVKDRNQIDQAIASHGRILHDATVVALNAGKDGAGNVGQINWQDPAASSLSEMVVSISEAFGSGLVDNQMATAFLTGIVAETERFSNPKTSPKVMTMSAQLMAAGANQQLISAKLAAPPAPPTIARQTPADQAAATDHGTLVIDHPPAETSREVFAGKPGEKPAAAAPPSPSPARPTPEPEAELDADGSEILIDEQGNLQTAEQPASPPPLEKEAEEPPMPSPQPMPEPPPPEEEPEPQPEPTPPPVPPVATKPPPPYQPPQAAGHELLAARPGHQVEDNGGPFAANVRPEWADYEELATDPLGNGEDLANEPEAANLANQARSSLQTAYNEEPFRPDLEPAEDIGASGELAVAPPEAALPQPTSTEAHDNTPTPTLPLPPNNGHPVIPRQPASVPSDAKDTANEPPKAPPGPPPLIMPPTAPIT